MLLIPDESRNRAHIYAAGDNGYNGRETLVPVWFDERSECVD